jgi:hypothetical protein
MIIPALINSIIFLSLSALHFYWSAGGKLNFGEALPKNRAGDRLLNPTPFHSALVGVFLLIFSMYYLVKIEIVSITLSPMALSGIGWFIATIFLIRAMGDFKYVGFFKKIKNTDFAKQDTRYFSPLCLWLFINAVLVELL